MVPEEAGSHSEQDLRVCGYDSIRNGYQPVTKQKENTWRIMFSEVPASLYAVRGHCFF